MLGHHILPLPKARSFKAVARKAFEDTYNHRLIDNESPFWSTVSAFTGFQYKYTRKKTSSPRVVAEWKLDRRIYNWLEFLVFIPSRLIKNTVKLGTEFIWNLAAGVLANAAKKATQKAEAIANREFQSSEASSRYKTPVSVRAKIFGYEALGFVANLASYVPWLVAKAGQTITSPFCGMKETFAYFAHHDHDINGDRKSLAHVTVGVVAAGLRGLISTAAYASIAVFAAPVVGAALIASGSVGTQIVTGLGVAVNWVAGLPVVSTVGSLFVSGLTSVGSSLGLSLSIGTGFASAAAVAGTTLLATPVLSGLRALARNFLPFKSSEKFPKLNHSTTPTSDIEMEAFKKGPEPTLGPKHKPKPPGKLNQEETSHGTSSSRNSGGSHQDISNAFDKANKEKIETEEQIQQNSETPSGNSRLPSPVTNDNAVKGSSASASASPSASPSKKAFGSSNLTLLGSPPPSPKQPIEEEEKASTDEVYKGNSFSS